MEERAVTQKPTIASETMEAVVFQGDLTDLSPKQRVEYYNAVCHSLGLNPLTRPFEYLKLQGKLILYARKDCTEQLRQREKVNLTITAREKFEDVYVVTARAILPNGRTDESTGAVSVAGLRGEALANAYMKAETKAKRRVTLSIVGLGWMDESEIESTGGRKVKVDYGTGEILEPPVPMAVSPITIPEAKASPAQPTQPESPPPDEEYAAGLQKAFPQAEVMVIPKPAKTTMTRAANLTLEDAQKLLTQFEEMASRRGMSPEAYKAIRAGLCEGVVTAKRLRDVIAEARKWEPAPPGQPVLDEISLPEEEK